MKMMGVLFGRSSNHLMSIHYSINDFASVQVDFQLTSAWMDKLKFRGKNLQPVADLHSKILDAPLPPGGIFGKIVCWRPPGELAPPPRGNNGSATANVY